MVLNISRAKQFHLCERLAFNTYHRQLTTQRSMNLTDGAAFHRGVAVGRATKDWKKAEEAALEDLQSNTQGLDPLLVEDHWDLTRCILQKFREQYETEQYQIIQPEVEFDVELPNSGHNCIFQHHIEMTGPSAWEERWGLPSPQAILEKRILSPHTTPMEDCDCWQSHRLAGRTDAIVQWNGNIWLDDYKTSSIAGPQFWDQWQLDMQMSAYIYGIWRALRLRPRGFFIHMLYKPSEKQVEGWNKKRKSGSLDVKDYLRYEREAFLRTEDDLKRAESWVLQTCQEWERQVVSGVLPGVPFNFNPSSHSCLSYNRRCDYWHACCSHEQPGELNGFQKRDPDYVDLKQIGEAKPPNGVKEVQA
jgi:hypothetical protein